MMIDRRLVIHRGEHKSRGAILPEVRDESKSSQSRAGALGKTRRWSAFEHEVLNTAGFAIFSFATAISIFIDGVDFGFQALDFRVGIEPTIARRNEGLFHKADGIDKVSALLLWKQGVT